MREQPDRFECVTDEAWSVLTVRPRGPLDLASAETLRLILLKALADQPRGIIVDLSGVTVRDDLCLTVFTAVARHAQAWPGCPVVLCGASPADADRLHALGIDLTLPVRRTPAQAREQIRRSRARLEREAREHFPPKPESLGAARGLAAAVCARWHVPGRACEVVQLVLTELMSNAVRHAGTPVDVVLRCTTQFVHVAVRDKDHRLPRVCGPLEPDADGGRGLIVVEAFAASWGSTPTADGKVVWAAVRHRHGGR